MTHLEDIAAGGPGFALMTAWMARDYSSQQTLAAEYKPTELLDATVALAGLLAGQTATYLRDATGASLSDEPDGGLLKVFTFAQKTNDLTPADPATPQEVLLARDSFFAGLTASLADQAPDAENRSYVAVQFWPGWDGDDLPYVLAGIAMALARLFHLSMIPELSAVESDSTEHAADLIHEALAEVRAEIAASTALA